jgi:hypothetical protein
MNESCELITVNTGNLDKQNFFCYMSKRKAPGYTQKRKWLAVLMLGLSLWSASAKQARPNEKNAHGYEYFEKGK